MALVDDFLVINRISSPQWDPVTAVCPSHRQINSVSGNWLNNALASMPELSDGGHSHRRDLASDLLSDLLFLLGVETW